MRTFLRRYTQLPYLIDFLSTEQLKYVKDKYVGSDEALVEVSDGGTFHGMVAARGMKNIVDGDVIHGG